MPRVLALLTLLALASPVQAALPVGVTVDVPATAQTGEIITITVTLVGPASYPSGVSYTAGEWHYISQEVVPPTALGPGGGVTAAAGETVVLRHRIRALKSGIIYIGVAGQPYPVAVSGELVIQQPPGAAPRPVWLPLVARAHD